MTNHYYDVMKQVMFNIVMTIVYVSIVGRFLFMVYQDFKKLWRKRDEE